MGNCLGNRDNSDSMLMCGENGEGQFIGQAQPLCREQEVWSSEVPLTPGALQGKRDTFWDTAPVYEGRKEIWDALRAACEAVDLEDYDLAQAILQGANILLPRGHLTESYDELGNRYVVPKYCISQPSNMINSLDNDDSDPEVTTKLLKEAPTASKGSSEIRRRRTGLQNSGPTMVIKIRLSTLAKDTKITLPVGSRVMDIKKKLSLEHNVDPKKLTMLYSGRVLNNGTLVKDLDIPKGFVIQAIVM